MNTTQSHLRINIDFVSNSQEIKQQVILSRNLASTTFGLNKSRVLKTLSNLQNWTNEAKLWAMILVFLFDTVQEERCPVFFVVLFCFLLFCLLYIKATVKIRPLITFGVIK